MKMTEQELFDYMRCPAYYDMKNIRMIPLQEEKTSKELLDTVGKYFFVNLFSGRFVSTSEMKKKWDVLCQQNEDTMTIKKTMEGMGLLMKFYNWAEREKLVVLDIGSRYTLNVGDVEVSGDTGVIVSDGQGGQELIIVDFGSRAQDQTIVDMKLKYTMQAYAFQKLNNKLLRGIRVHNVKYDKVIHTDRSHDDFARLETAINGVGRSLEEKIFYPTEGMCITCPGKVFCRHWSR